MIDIQGCRVLIIADDTPMISCISDALNTHSSITINTVETIDKAYDALSATKYDLLLLHYRLANSVCIPCLQPLVHFPIILIGNKGSDREDTFTLPIGTIDLVEIDDQSPDAFIKDIHRCLNIWADCKYKLSDFSKRYEDIVEALPDIVYELEPNGHFTFLNQSVKLLGYHPSELIGKHFSILLFDEDVAQVSREYVLPLYKNNKTGVRNSPKLFDERRGIDRKTENLELRLKHKKDHRTIEPLFGSLISYGEVASVGAYRSTNQDEKKDFAGTVGIIHDITLRRKSEEMLRKMYQAVDQSPNAIAILNRDLTIDYVNASFFGLTGSSPDQSIGRKIIDFLGDPSDYSFIDDLNNSVKSGIEWRAELRCPRIGASPYWSSILFSAVRSPFGIITHYLCLMEDITRKRLLDDLLKEAKDAAEGANRAKSEFLASFSHQINEPIDRILELTAALSSDIKTDKNKHQLLRIRESSEYLKELFGDISALSQLQANPIQQEPTRFNIRELGQEVALFFQSQADKKELSFDLRVDDGGFPYIIADKGIITTILNILLSNAVKYTEEGRIDLQVSVKAKDGAPTLFVLVRDTGIGISGIDQQKLFKRSENIINTLSTPTSRKTGLGLIIAKELTQKSGGDIWVESIPDQGSVFTFFIPVRTINSNSPLDPEIGIHNRSLSILVAEDNPANLEFLCTSLKQAGYRVASACTSDEILNALKSNDFDLVIIDLQVSGMNGLTITTAIRSFSGSAYDPNIPIIALSTIEEKQDRSRYKIAGFTAQITKPIDMNNLYLLIDNIFRKREYFDFAALSRKYSDSIDELRRVLTIAYQESPRMMTTLVEAHKSKKHTEIDLALPALVSCFADLYAARAIRLVKRYQKALFNNDILESDNLIEELFVECKNIKRQLKKALDKT